MERRYAAPCRSHRWSVTYCIGSVSDFGAVWTEDWNHWGGSRYFGVRIDPPRSTTPARCLKCVWKIWSSSVPLFMLYRIAFGSARKAIGIVWTHPYFTIALFSEMLKNNMVEKCYLYGYKNQGDRTCWTSIEFNSHRDPAVPWARVKTDMAGYKWSFDVVKYDSESIDITLK